MPQSVLYGGIEVECELIHLIGSRNRKSYRWLLLMTLALLIITLVSYQMTKVIDLLFLTSLITLVLGGILCRLWFDSYIEIAEKAMEIDKRGQNEQH